MTKLLVGFYPQNVEVTAIYAPHKSVKAMLSYASNIFLDSVFRVCDCPVLIIIGLVFIPIA